MEVKWGFDRISPAKGENELFGVMLGGVKNLTVLLQNTLSSAGPSGLSIELFREILKPKNPKSLVGGSGGRGVGFAGENLWGFLMWVKRGEPQILLELGALGVLEVFP